MKKKRNHHRQTIKNEMFVMVKRKAVPSKNYIQEYDKSREEEKQQRFVKLHTAKLSNNRELVCALE